MRTHGGQGVEAPPALPSAAPGAFEHILASVPALRRAGLDELADSIEAMAHEVGLDDETVATAVSLAEPESEPVQAAPERDPSRFRERLERSRLEIGSTIVVVAVVLIAVLGRVRTVLRQVFGMVGRSSHAQSVLRRALRSVRHGVIRRRELVWGAVAVSTMSLVVGWVVTRLP